VRYMVCNTCKKEHRCAFCCVRACDVNFNPDSDAGTGIGSCCSHTEVDSITTCADTDVTPEDGFTSDPEERIHFCLLYADSMEFAARQMDQATSVAVFKSLGDDARTKANVSQVALSSRPPRRQKLE